LVTDQPSLRDITAANREAIFLLAREIGGPILEAEVRQMYEPTPLVEGEGEEEDAEESEPPLVEDQSAKVRAASSDPSQPVRGSTEGGPVPSSTKKKWAASDAFNRSKY